MTNLTKGQITVTPLGLKTAASLREMGEIVHSESGLIGDDGGWGSIYDPVDLPGRIGRRSYDVGGPDLFAEEGHLPGRLKFRIYWWQLDRRTFRYLGQQSDVAASMQLEACDLIISGSEGSYLCLVTLRDSSLRSEVVPRLQALFESAGKPMQVSYEANALNVIDPDFFFWLMYRCHQKPEITSNLAIEFLRDTNGLDHSSRQANLTNGVSLDRAELLAMIMGGYTKFGPATIDVVDSELELDLGLKIFPDGGFQPILGRSYYHSLESDMSAAHTRERLVDDIAYLVLPALISSYNSDDSWRHSDRAAYIQAARDSMRSVLASLS